MRLKSRIIKLEDKMNKIVEPILFDFLIADELFESSKISYEKDIFKSNSFFIVINFVKSKIY